MNRGDIAVMSVVAIIASAVIMLTKIMADSTKDAYIAQHPVINWNEITVTKELSENGEVVIIYVRDSIVCYKLLKNE